MVTVSMSMSMLEMQRLIRHMVLRIVKIPPVDDKDDDDENARRSGGLV